jgi:hypothetical protein
MDLLAKRYASPCFFINGFVQTGRFAEFVDDIMETTVKEENDTKNWEFFLHKVFDGSYADFIEEMKINEQHKTMSERTIETTVQHSMDILNGFNPTEGGE